jgi:hypothetical protein
MLPRGEKKTEKTGKKIIKKPNCEKNRLNQLKFLKNGPVWFSFGFISLKPKKPNRTETEKNRKNPSQTCKKPSQTCKKPSQTGLNQFFP